MTRPTTILVSEDSHEAAVAMGRELATMLGDAGVSSVLPASTGKMPVPPTLVLAFPRLVDLPPDESAVQRLRRSKAT